MAYTPANPWNFPVHRCPGHYNNSYSDVYFTAANAITDFIDTASVTCIMAVYMPLGFMASSYVVDSTWPCDSKFPHFFTIGKKAGGIDNNIFMRGYFDTALQQPRLQFYTYDGTTYRGLTIDSSQLGYSPEGRILQIAYSNNGPAGKMEAVINGQYFSSTYTPRATIALHSTNNARLVFNNSANQGGDTFASVNLAEYYPGPMLIDDSPLDLTPQGADYNRIFDENGDFLWAGEDGALWLSDDGSVKPWYYSEDHVPTIQKGTMSATFSTYGYPGHAFGTKSDFTPADHMAVAEALPGIELLWDMSMPWGAHYQWITCDHNTKCVMRAMNNSYGITRMPPERAGRVGSCGFDFNIDGNYGYYNYTTTHPFTALANLATELSMTYTMNFEQGANETFGYRKLAGWGTSSGSANFRVTGPWPSEGSRWIMNTVYPEISAQFSLGWTVPNNFGYSVWTWQWDNGMTKLWVNGVVRASVDRTGTDTRLRNINQAFGFRDSTSSSSGNVQHTTDFLMVNSVALTDQQIIDLHAAILAGA